MQFLQSSQENKSPLAPYLGKQKIIGFSNQSVENLEQRKRWKFKADSSLLTKSTKEQEVSMTQFSNRDFTLPKLKVDEPSMIIAQSNVVRQQKGSRNEVLNAPLHKSAFVQKQSYLVHKKMNSRLKKIIKRQVQELAKPQIETNAQEYFSTQKQKKKYSLQDNRDNVQKHARNSVLAYLTDNCKGNESLRHQKPSQHSPYTGLQPINAGLHKSLHKQKKRSKPTKAEGGQRSVTASLEKPLSALSGEHSQEENRGRNFMRKLHNQRAAQVIRTTLLQASNVPEAANTTLKIDSLSVKKSGLASVVRSKAQFLYDQEIYQTAVKDTIQIINQQNKTNTIFGSNKDLRAKQSLAKIKAIPLKRLKKQELLEFLEKTIEGCKIQPELTPTSSTLIPKADMLSRRREVHAHYSRLKLKTPGHNSLHQSLEAQALKREAQEELKREVLSQCDCKEEFDKVSHSPDRSTKRSGSSKLSKRKRQQLRSRDLSNPFRPCRRGCATCHSPIHHTCRFSAFSESQSGFKTKKLEIKGLKKKRTQSQDQGFRDKRAFFNSIDWRMSALYQCALTGDLSYLGEAKLDIYTQVETEYFASFIKKEKDEGHLCSNSELKAIFEKALYTLKILMKSLLQEKNYDTLKQQYIEDQKDNKAENTIKLLMRCYKIYFARDDTIKILKLAIKREKMLEEVDSASFLQLLELSSRILKKIEQLQEENLNLRRPFVIDQKNYAEYVLDHTNRLSQEFGIGRGKIQKDGRIVSEL